MSMSFQFLNHHSTICIPNFNSSVLRSWINKTFSTPKHFCNRCSMTCEYFNASAIVSIPNSNTLIFWTTSHIFAFIRCNHWLPRNACHEVFVTFQRLSYLISSFCIPDEYVVIHTSRGNFLAIRRKWNKQNPMFMSYTCMQWCFSLKIPNSYSGVSRSRSQTFSIWWKCNTQNSFTVSLKCRWSTSNRSNSKHCFGLIS